MFRSEDKKNGFTLIEVIVSLVLLGIMGAIVGMGIANIAKGYIMSTENLDTTQKGTITLSLIVKELTTIKTISAAAANSITFTKADGLPHTITLAGNNLTLDGDTLTDQVSSLALTYYDTYNSAASAYNANTTTIIGINLVLIPLSGYLFPNAMTTPPLIDRVYIRPYNQ